VFAGSQMNLQKTGQRFSRNAPIRDLPLPVVSSEVFHLSTVTDTKRESAKYQLVCLIEVQSKPFVDNLTARVCFDILFEHLREKHGLVYSVDAEFLNNRDHSVFTIVAEGVAPEKITEVESLVRELISLLVVDEQRFIRCKDRLLKQMHMKDISGVDIFKSMRSEIIYNNSTINSDTADLESAKDVSFADVQSVLSVLNSTRPMIVLEVP